MSEFISTDIKKSKRCLYAWASFANFIGFTLPSYLFFIFCLKMELFGSVCQLWSMLAEQNGSLGSTGCTEFAPAH
jgi:hypothetical protein